MSTNKFLSKEEEQQVVQAIQSAEHQTSGEIRVHIESVCKGNVLDRAAWLFKSLKMHKTAQRNGVLIYLSTSDRKFAIIGDAGINAVVPAGFWDDVKELMIGNFSKGEMVEGFVAGIGKVGEKLKAFFPYQEDDVDELSDEISYGK
ncbi:MAG: TPM domain-containing protein [Bacteroidetes bacterium]|nr:TPM domain-containing protein [Bacteroidota bacterium]MCL6102648.1 TPM domain-containing protein [Bacteroidota bacterium]